MSDINNKINDEILENVSGGMSDEEKKRREEAEKKLHGTIVKDAVGNVTFTDKTGVTGSFSASDWAKLSANWAYTGNPEYYMETINVNELNGVLMA